MAYEKTAKIIINAGKEAEEASTQMKSSELFRRLLAEAEAGERICPQAEPAGKNFR
jgi:hypothetical protein